MMTSLEYYLQDGANWQAKAILCILQFRQNEVLDIVWNKETHRNEGDIYVGRYENCREQGYVFTLSYKGKQRHYAVYEHRNSDDIIVLISNEHSINTPSIKTMWADKPENATKYDYDKAFPVYNFEECVDFLVEDMSKTLKEWKDKTGEQLQG